MPPWVRTTSTTFLNQAFPSKTAAPEPVSPRGRWPSEPGRRSSSANSTRKLDVTWILEQGNPARTIGVDCGDGIAFFLAEVQGDFDVVTDISLPTTATDKLVPSSNLIEGREYHIEVETFTGGVKSTMDGETDT